MKPKERPYVRRSQKDYSMPFKLSVVHEYEETEISYSALSRKYGIQGSDTIHKWVIKYGSTDVIYKTSCSMNKPKDLKIVELEAQIEMLKRKNTRLEHELENRDHKAAILDILIDIAEKEYQIKIRKNSFPEQPKNTKK
ncbi:MAG: hypothetical protein ACRC9P_03075 [Bacteroides sp.]